MAKRKPAAPTFAAPGDFLKAALAGYKKTQKTAGTAGSALLGPAAPAPAPRKPPPPSKPPPTAASLVAPVAQAATRVGTTTETAAVRTKKLPPLVPKAGTIGSPQLGPPVPVTPAGTRPQPVAPVEVTHAARVADRAYHRRIAAESRLTRANKAYTSSLATYHAFLKSHQAKQLNPADYATYTRLHNTTVAAYKRGAAAYNHAVRHLNRSNSALALFGELVQRHDEYQQAQKTGGVFQPSDRQLFEAAKKKMDAGDWSLGDVAKGVAGYGEHLVTGEVPRLAATVAGRNVSQKLGLDAKPYDILGRTVGTAEGLGVAGVAAGETAGNLAGRLAIGTGTDIGKAVDAAKQVASGGRWGGQAPSSGGAPIGQIAKASIQEQGILPEDAAKTIGLGSAKILVGGAGAVASLRHPYGAAKIGGPEGISLLVGMAQPFGLVSAMTDPHSSWASKQDLMENQVILPIFNDFVSKYGKDASFGEVFKAAEKQPVLYGLNSLMVLGPLAKAATLLYGISRDMTLAEAIRAIHDPVKARTLTAQVRGETVRRGVGDTRRARRQPVLDAEGNVVKTPAGLPQEVTLHQARHPLTRAVLQRPYDAASKVAGRVPGIRRTWIAENSRALRALSRQNARSVHRMPAAVQAAAKDLEWVMGRKNKDYQVLLATIAQKPHGLSDEQWTSAVMADLKDQIESGRFTPPGGKESPAATRLLNRIKKYETREETARSGRMHRAARNISEEQDKQAGNLALLQDKRKTVIAEVQQIRADDTLTPEQKASMLADRETELRVNRKATDVVKQDLTDLSVDETPINSPERDAFRAKLEAHPNFDQQMVDDGMLMADTFARGGARMHGGDPADMYTRIGLENVGSAADLPEGALTQIRLDVQHPQSEITKRLEQVGLSPRKGETDAEALARAERELVKRDPYNNQIASKTVLPDGTDLTGLVEIGRPSYDQWLNRIRTVFKDDPTEINKWLTWYETAYDVVLATVGGDVSKAEQLLSGFVASQANASPTGGINSVLQVLWKQAHGLPVGAKEISAAVGPIKAALGNETIRKGFAAKLTDFKDALEQNDLRTWMGNHALGGSPAPVDVHALRDAGYLTYKLTQRAIDRGYNVYFVAKRDKETGELLRPKGMAAGVHLIASRKDMPKGKMNVLADSPDGAGGLRYENAGRFYREAADHLNSLDGGRGYLGRNDWTAAHAQAAGWGAIQKFWGAEPETIQSAIDANTIRVTGTYLGHPKTVSEVTSDILDASPLFDHQEMKTVGNTVQWRSKVPKRLKTMKTLPEQETVNRLLEEGPFSQVVTIRDGEAKYRQSGNTVVLKVRPKEGDFVKAVGELHNELPQLIDAISVPEADGSITFLFRSKSTGDEIKIGWQRINRAIRDVNARDPSYSVLHERSRADVAVASRVRAGVSEDDRVLRAFTEPGGLSAGRGREAAARPGEVAGGAPAARGRGDLASGRGRAVHDDLGSSPEFSVEDGASLSADDLAAFNAAMRLNSKAEYVDPIAAAEIGESKIVMVKGSDGAVVAGGTIGPDGYIGNLFSNVPNVGMDVFARQIKEGGKYGNALDPYLPMRYAEKSDVREVARLPFDERIAPEGWDIAKNGRPDLVFFAKVEPGTPYRVAPYVESYDRAMELTQQVAARGKLLAQTREEGILGATHFLSDTHMGKRIIYLTENADVSTLVHELAHAAADDMYAFYPQEFAKVEDVIGKPYTEWGVPEHEQFAQWWERYVASGRAPTPELIDSFDRMKVWMRQIYGGMNNMLGSRVPIETRILFDSWLGAYSDDNVFRIAMNMGLEGWGKEDLQIQRYGGAKVISEEELRTLRKRQATVRAKNNSVVMKARLKDMQAQLDELDSVVGPWTQKQHEQYLDLSAKVLNQQAELAVRTDRREQNLRDKLSSLEKALTRGTDNRRFQGALQAVQWIAEDREQILRDVWGPDFEKTFGDSFAARRDLLADWLVSHNLLEPTFERGTATYFPHTTEDPTMLPPQGPAASLTSRVVGKSREDLLKLHKRNQLLLWQRGDWNADPAVLVQANLRAQSYSWMNEVKKQLWDMGRPLTPEEAANLPKDVYLINIRGTPIGYNLRRQLEGGSTTHDVQRAHDALSSSTDNHELEDSLTTYWNNFALDSDNLPRGWATAEGQFFKGEDGRVIASELRVVPKSAVHTLLRPLRGGRSAPGKAWDVGTSMARFATIYANFPGYMLTNLGGNIGFLVAHQGPWLITNLMHNSGKLLGDQKLMTRIMGETGDLPAFAAISRGRGFDEAPMAASKNAESWYLNKLSVVDRYPRAMAWMHEARKRGYHSADDMIRLIEGKTEKTARDRAAVQEMSVNHMIDFNLLSPWERNVLTRALFIWPFVRGATKWPFWYAKNYPERAAIFANVGATLEERRKRMMEWGGPIPDYAEGYFPISTTSDRKHANIVKTGSTAMTLVAADELKLIRATVASIIHKKIDDNSLAIVDQMSPVLYDLIKLITQHNQYGQTQSIRETVTGDFFNDTVPYVRIFRNLTDPNSTPRAFEKDRAFTDRALRQIVRIDPETVTLPVLFAQAQQHGDVTTKDRIDQAHAQVDKDWKTISAKGPAPYLFRRAATMKIIYEDRAKEYAREKAGEPDFIPTPVETAGGKTIWNVKYTPNSYEKAKIMYEVIHHYLPHMPIPTPDRILHDPSIQAKPTSALGTKVMDHYLSQVGQLLEPPMKLHGGATKLKTGKKIAKELAGASR